MRLSHGYLPVRGKPLSRTVHCSAWAVPITQCEWRRRCPPPKKKVSQDRYSITKCGTRAKSRVTVTVARPRGWGTGIRSTDTVSQVRHGPSVPGVDPRA